MEIPLCYRFDPTDEEIILHYLYNKTHGFPLSSSSAMIDCDLYDETDAWKNFFKATRETTLYFFTKLRKKSEKGSRVERATGSGTWRTQGDEHLYNGGDRRQHIGYKRSLTFIPKKTEEKGKWVMKEYRLHDSLLRNKKSDLVVCRIKKKVIEEETMRNNNSGNFLGGKLIVSGFHQGMNMGALEVDKNDYIGSNQNQERYCYPYDFGGNYNVYSENPVSGELKVPDGLQEVGMMEALEGKESDYIDNSSLGFIMNDLEETDKAGRISEDLDTAYWSWKNQISTQEFYTPHDQHRGMEGLQIEESGYIIDSNQGVTLEEVDMAGSNNQNEHVQECHIYEANGGNCVNSKNCLDGENIVSGISEEMMRAVAEADDYIVNNVGFTMEYDCVNGSCEQNIMEDSSTSLTHQHGAVGNAMESITIFIHR
ncbi:NAC transcription factor 56-like [Pistacia vera]|uniref:NAC transcription factor 56-like n=1 Tax=Pistacia vera TaxID=55513 RepID=UPI001262DA4E|nr:NAC transcription factor 56-like [Pistacia vera]